MIRRAGLVVTLWVLGAAVQAETLAVGNPRGLNNADASMLINDNEAQDLLNVDITDNGYGIKKRSGYSQFKTIGTSTWGVRGGYYFRDASGNNLLIHANNQSVFKSVNSGAYAAFITTDTAGSYYDFTDSQGYLYRATSNRDEYCRYDGTTLTYYPSAPKGTQIEAMSDRMLIAGTAANPNRVYFSKVADFTDFTIGGLTESDPFYEEFGLPGQSITAIKYVGGRVLVWTKDTLSFWAGSNQYDGVIESISSNIGTNQPNSIIEDLGNVYFQAVNGHWYVYDGNLISRISEPINGSVNNFVFGETRSFLTTTQTDFELGTIGSGLSSIDSPGDVVFDSNGILIDAFSDGDNTSNPTWTELAVVADIGVINDGSSNVLRSSWTGYGNSWFAVYTENTNQNSGAWAVDMKTNITDNQTFQIRLCTTTPNADAQSAIGCYSASFDNSVNLMRIYKNSGLIAEASIGIAPFSTTAKQFMFARSSEGVLTAYLDGTAILSTTNSDYSTFSHIAFAGSYSSPIPSEYYDLDNIYMLPSTATYQSQPIYIGTGVTSFGQFNVGQSITGNASIAYAIYTDSDTTIDLTDNTTFTSSQTISNGNIPTLTRDSYINVTADFTRTASTESTVLNDYQINWYEGSVTRTFGIADENHRLVWSVAENASNTTNATYIYDTRFNSWLKYDVPMDAPVLVNQSLFFGGPSTGVVYAFPSGTSDAGTAITAYWKSKDFIGNDPFVEKNWLNYSVIGKTYTGSNLDIAYSANTLTATTNNFSLSDSNNISLKRVNGNFPAGTMGTFFNMQFGNDDADAPFEIYTFRLEYAPRPWRVLP